MQVLSVNVAQVRTIEFRGEVHQTGIFKLPSDRPLMPDGGRRKVPMKMVGNRKSPKARIEASNKIWRDD